MTGAPNQPEVDNAPYAGPERRRKPMFDPTINFGAILQIGTVMIGIGLFAARGERDVALINAEVRSLRESTADSINRLTVATADLRNSIAPLSTLLVRIDQLERGNNEIRGVNAAQEDRISRLVENLAVMRARLGYQPGEPSPRNN